MKFHQVSHRLCHRPKYFSDLLNPPERLIIILAGLLWEIPGNLALSNTPQVGNTRKILGNTHFGLQYMYKTVYGKMAS